MTEVNTIEEMKALLDSINVKYRSNATESSLKHLISKHKALIPSDDRVAQNETESDLEVLGSVTPQGENSFTEVDVSVDQPVTEFNQPEIKPAEVPDVNVPLEALNTPEPVVESEIENVVGDVIETITVSNEDFDKFVDYCSQDVKLSKELENLAKSQNWVDLPKKEPETSDNTELGAVDQTKLPQQLIIKKNVLKTFIDELYAAARLGYLVSDEKKSINILDIPYKVKLTLPEDAVQSVAELVPHMKIKVKTYKYKEFIEEFMQFAYAGAKVGKVNNFIISSGQYVFEVYVDENYVLRRNKDYYAGKI